MKTLLFIGTGGFIGSVLRYLVSGWVQTASKSIQFPYGTLTVNLLGCLIIGFLSQLADLRSAFSAETRAFVFVGILGGFTTFSTFGNESMNLFRTNENFLAVFNLGVHVIGGLICVWLGRIIAYFIWR